jgi:hypothetical protein
MPEPKPSFLGRYSHWIPVCHTYRIPHSTAKSAVSETHVDLPRRCVCRGSRPGAPERRRGRVRPQRWGCSMGVQSLQTSCLKYDRARLDSCPPRPGSSALKSRALRSGDGTWEFLSTRPSASALWLSTPRPFGSAHDRTDRS